MAEHNSWSGLDNVYKDKAKKALSYVSSLNCSLQLKHLIEKQNKNYKEEENYWTELFN